ncbi:O-antigen ligase family protein [Roseovarius sp.]|uniref:O-antigen ligase family protein n=1 Tax=Roseovarius sp. TaxID=1486281 RepID=UPI0035654CB8
MSAAVRNQGGTPLFRLHIGALVALVLGTFMVVSHLPVLSIGLRQGLMMVAILAGAILAALGFGRSGPGRVLAVTLPAVMLITIFGLHNLSHPALTEYAATKRAVFPVVILSCLVVFPLAIYAFDRNLKYTINILIAVSILFAVLAFAVPTGENIRRSGIELNPVMHAKLLFFPFFLAAARPAHLQYRLLFLATLLLSIVACLKTGSRSPIAVVIIILCLDTILNAGLKSAIRLISYGGIILASVIMLLDFVPREIAERFTLDALGAQSDEGDRLFLLAFAFDLISQNPEGIGMGNMSAYFWLFAPHNIVLEAIMDFGFLAALPYVGLLAFSTLLAFRALRSRDTSRRFVAIWFFFFLGQSLIGGEMTFPSMLLYIPMGLLILMRPRYGGFYKHSRSPMREQMAGTGVSTTPTQRNEQGV